MAHSPTWAVLPVKAFDDAKSRLQPVLDVEQRREFARGLMLHSLDTLQACDGIDHVVVVSADREALLVAEARGATALAESGSGLNPALEAAQRHAVEHGAAGLLVLPSDLPFLTAADIDALVIAGREAGVVIAPDRARQGTNALLLRPAGAIGFSFGKLSFQRHVDLTIAAGLPVVEVSRAGLAFDVDLPQDWRDLQAAGWSGPLPTEPSRRGT